MSTQLQNKLLHYAPEPPEKVWDAVASALDESVVAVFPEKLYAFEASPPGQVWNKINDQLSNSPESKTVPLRKTRQVFRYSAAAAVFILLALTTALLINKKTGSTAIADAPVITSSPRQKTDITNFPAPNPEAVKNSLLVATNQQKTVSQKNNSEEKKTLLSKLRPQLQLGSIAIANNFIPRLAQAKHTVSTTTATEKYMVYSDDDGNAVRLSKKLFDFIACVKEDIACKQEMQQLQQKVSTSVLSTDFIGVLETLKNLKENQ